VFLGQYEQKRGLDVKKEGIVFLGQYEKRGVRMLRRIVLLRQ
jgi:hypothetical protein